MSATPLGAFAQLATETGQFSFELSRIDAIRSHHGADHGVGQQGVQSRFAVARVHPIVLSLK
jgi:hypothetical protein